MSNISSFEEQLALHGRIIYTNVGDSMMPLIKEGRDVMIIERPTGRLGKGDVPLYIRDNGQYVLHRVLKVLPDGYIICGDNRASLERDITDRHIIGVLTGLIRDGREISFDTFSYKLYRFWICELYFIRFAIFKFRALIRCVIGIFKPRKRKGNNRK